jgi:nucleoside-diphosphate-sugar epimerase
MNILITGIHGFVGTNIVQSLKANHSIYGLDILFKNIIVPKKVLYLQLL